MYSSTTAIQHQRWKKLQHIQNIISTCIASSIQHKSRDGKRSSIFLTLSESQHNYLTSTTSMPIGKRGKCTNLILCFCEIWLRAIVSPCFQNNFLNLTLFPGVLVTGIAHISHNQQWCTFFELVYFLAERTRNGWPILTANLRAFWFN